MVRKVVEIVESVASPRCGKLMGPLGGVVWRFNRHVWRWVGGGWRWVCVCGCDTYTGNVRSNSPDGTMKFEFGAFRFGRAGECVDSKTALLTNLIMGEAIRMLEWGGGRGGTVRCARFDTKTWPIILETLSTVHHHARYITHKRQSPPRLIAGRRKPSISPGGTGH